MAINKVEFAGQTLIDLSKDTVTAANLLKGATAHDKAGNIIVGTADSGGEGGGAPDYGINTFVSVFAPSNSDTTLIPYPAGANMNNAVSLAIVQQEQHGSLGDGWRVLSWTKSYSRDNEQTSHGLYSKDGFIFETPKKQKPVTVSANGITVSHNASGAFFALVPHLVVAIVKR